MKIFYRTSVLTLTVFLALTSCSSDSDLQNDENLNVIALKANVNKDESKFEISNQIEAYYSHAAVRHYYTIQDQPAPPSYFKERVLGSVGPVVTSNPYITIWYNTNSGDSYITPYADEIQGGNGWTKIKMLGGSTGMTGTLVPVYEYYNAARGSHFYTTSLDELGYGKDGWQFNGPRFHVNVGGIYQ